MIGGRWRKPLLALIVAAADTPAPAETLPILGPLMARDVHLLPDNTPDASDSAAEARKPGDPPWRLSSAANLDLLSNTSGGLRRGTRLLAKVSLAAAYDAGGGWTGLVSGQFTNGVSFSGALVGDVQTVSNIEAVGAFRVYQVWLAHAIPLNGRIKFGLTDLNADFDVQTVGGVFLNSSDGIAAEFSHTGRNGPSIFPTTALALTAKLQPAPGWTIDLGAFDGVAGNPQHPKRFAIELGPRSGALLVGQLQRVYDSGLRLEAGAWTYTAAFDALDRFDAGGAPARLHTSHGAYGLAEARLLGPADGRSLSGWVRAGIADDRVNRIAGYTGGGLVLNQPLPGRANDTAGVSVMRAWFGDPARRAQPGLRRAETTIEATYRAAAFPRVAVQPDLQYVIHPGGLPGVRDAVVVGVRLNFAVGYAPRGRHAKVIEGMP